MARVELDFLSNMRFGDGDALKQFSLAHRLAHDQFADAIDAADSIAVDGFDVSDERARQAWELLMIDAKDAPPQARDALNQWLLLHSQLHQAEYDAIGLGVAYDLSTVDMSNPDEFNTWMQTHQQVHAIVADALGITS